MEGVYCNKKPANAGNSRREEAMKYDLRAIQRTALLVAIAAAMTLSGAKARADVTLSAMFPYTKVDPEYQELQELYARFHQQNPDITINFDYLDHDAYHVKMQALAISNNLPNILTLWPGKRTGYITDRGYARDLEPWIKRDDLAAAQRAVFLTPQARGGQVYELGVPFVNFTNVVYVNKKLLDQIKAERTAFQETADLPRTAPGELKRKLAPARSALESAYTAAVREYTKASKDDMANAVERELEQFKHDGDAPWVELFNTKDVKGWHTSEGTKATWRVTGGALVGNGALGYQITDREDYVNFRLRVEAKLLGVDADSGLCFRVQDPRVANAYEANIHNGRPGDGERLA